MSVSISGDGALTGIDQGLNVVGVLTASGGFSGNLTGNVTGTVNSTSGVTTLTQLNVGTGGTVITTTAGGLLGIGTANPSTKVHILGTGNGSTGSTGLSDSSVASALLLKPTTGSGTALALGARSTGGHYIQGLYDASSVDSVRDVQINPYGGSVGIGTFADAFGGVPGNSTFVVATTGIERLRIDSSGRITAPYQPAFFARPAGGYDISAGENNIAGTWTELFDRGNNFSNGTFTAPIAGIYQFTWNAFLQNETTRQDAYIMLNGSNIMREEISGYSGTANRSISVHGIYQLAANDNITFGVYSTAGVSIYVTAAPWCYACGYLIG